MQTPNLYQVLARRLKQWEEAFNDFVKALCRDPNVLKAYLVGSRARGEALPYSDYDVVVVVPDGLDKLEEAVRLRRLRERPFPLDLIVIHVSEENDKLYEKMMEKARRLC